MRRLGLSDWLPRSQAASVHLADHLRTTFAQHRIDAILDVGGNLGQYAMMLRMLVGYRGWIFSCEPNPAVARRMSARLRHDARWRLFPFALGQTEGTLSLQITRASEFTSFRAPSAESARLFGDLGEVTEVLEVPVRTLGAALASARECAPCRNVYLKLDTQGFDFEILRGAGAALDEVRALQTELAFQSLYEGSADWSAVHAFLGSRGFELSGVFPVNATEVGALIEADGVYVNSRAGHAPVAGSGAP